MADLNSEQRELLGKLVDDIRNVSNAMGPLAAEERALAESTKKTRERFEELKQTTKELAKSTGSLGKTFFDAAEGTAKYGKATKEVTESLGGLLGKIPYLGWAFSGLIKAIGGVVSATLDQNDALVKSYQTLSDFGALDVRGIEGIFSDLQKLKLVTSNIGQLENALKKLQPELSALGGSAAQGRKQFIDVMSNIIGTDLERELRKLGYTQEQISDNAAQYLAREARLGNTQTKNTQELTRETGKYLKELQELTMLTGLSREEQQRIRDQQLNEVRFNDYIEDLKAKGQTKAAERLQNFSVALEKFSGKDVASGFREQLVNGGAIVGDASVKFALATRGAGDRIGRDLEKGVINVPEALRQLGQAGMSTKDAFKAIVNISPETAAELGLSNEAMRGFKQMLKLTSDEELKRMMKEIDLSKGLMNEEIKRSLAERDLKLMLDKLVFSIGEKVIPMLTSLTEVARNFGKMVAKLIDKFGPYIGLKDTNLSALFINDLVEATEAIGDETKKLPKIISERNKLEQELTLAADDRLAKEKAYDAKKDSGMAFKLKRDAELAAEKEKEIKKKLSEVKEQEKAANLNITELGEIRKRKLAEIQQKAPAGGRGTTVDSRRSDLQGDNKTPMTAEQMNADGGGENPAAAQKILDFIAKKESGGDYNKQVGGRTDVELTKMSIAEVMDYQKSMKSQGMESTALGKYQVISKTLAGLVQKGVVSPTDKFDAATQEKIGMALLEGRGFSKYKSGGLSADEFADNLAKEWAALPTQSGKSHYAGVGSNKSLVSRESLMSQLQQGANGGVFAGPAGGYPVMLHGNEIVIPMKDAAAALSSRDVTKTDLPNSIGTSSGSDSGIGDMVSMLAGKMDEMIAKLNDSYRTQEELLQYTRA
jgi:muramidase (phage lysozyme)